MRLMEIVTEAERQTRTSDQHRLLLELTLLKLATAASPHTDRQVSQTSEPWKLSRAETGEPTRILRSTPPRPLDRQQSARMRLV